MKEDCLCKITNNELGILFILLNVFIAIGVIIVSAYIGHALKQRKNRKK